MHSMLALGDEVAGDRSQLCVLADHSMLASWSVECCLLGVVYEASDVCYCAVMAWCNNMLYCAVAAATEYR